MPATDKRRGASCAAVVPDSVFGATVDAFYADFEAYRTMLPP